MKCIIPAVFICWVISGCKEESRDHANQNIATVDTTHVQPEKPNPAKILENKLKEREKTKRDSLWKIRRAYCAKWHEQRQQLISNTTQLFIDSVYRPSLSNPNLPTSNLHLLNQLKSHIESNRQTEMSLYPVYKVSSLFSIIEHFDNIVYSEITALVQADSLIKFTDFEGKLINDRSKWSTIDTLHPEYLSHPRLKDLMDSLQLNENDILSLYSESEIWKSTITDIGLVRGECIEFNFYKVQVAQQDSAKSPILGCPFQIEIALEQSEKYDSLHRRTFERINNNTCRYDCLFKYEQSVSFGRLQGIENLYLAYTDDQLDKDTWTHYPQRSIGMIVGDTTVIELWKHTKDNFGCSCL